MSIKSFGVLINNLGNDDKSSKLTENINLLLNNRYIYSPTIFFLHRTEPKALCRCLQIQQNHAWGYDGTLIATDISSAMILKECVRAKRKIFYIYDLEWMKLDVLIYRELCKIYKNPEIDLIVQNQEQYEIVSKCWKTPVGIVKEFDYDELCKYVD